MVRCRYDELGQSQTRPAGQLSCISGEGAARLLPTLKTAKTLFITCSSEWASVAAPAPIILVSADVLAQITYAVEVLTRSVRGREGRRRLVPFQMAEG